MMACIRRFREQLGAVLGFGLQILYLIVMLNDSRSCEELQSLTLKQILEGEHLPMQQILTIKNIHNNIKSNLKLFTEYCRKNTTFTSQFIALGLKSPLHPTTDPHLRNIAYIAADVLSCDHESLADLFILPSNKTNLPSNKTSKEDELMAGGDQIEEEIQTDICQANSDQQVDKYRFLQDILDYANCEVVDQNCLNYITKALNILVRRKLSQLLQFFSQNEDILQRLVDLSHYPSIAHFLAKLMTDQQDNISATALQVKRKIIPLILSKIHSNIFNSETAQTLQCIEDILNSSRYGDLQERSELQQSSDTIVSGKQYSFHIQNIVSILTATQVNPQHFIGVTNSASFLTVVVNRMNMDEQPDFNFCQKQQFKPTLIYQIEVVYSSFCRLVALFRKIWEFKPAFQSQFWYMANKIAEPLVLLCKHSRFGQFYTKIAKQQRLQALKTLIYVACQIQVHGILLQTVATLLQKMLIQEEKLAAGQAQIVIPADLYNQISKHAPSIEMLVSSLLEETTKQRNKNENGIYFRKILVLFDNYFKHGAVLERYPQTSSLQTIFPLFSKQNCRIFAQKAAILNHPDGKKMRQVSQFQFLQKNNTIRQSNSPHLESQARNVEAIEEAKTEPQKKPIQIMFKLEGKLKALKDRVKQKQADKDLVTQVQSKHLENLNHSPLSETIKQTIDQSATLIRQKHNLEKLDQSSPVQACKQKQPQPGLNFFVRHLMIY